MTTIAAVVTGAHKAIADLHTERLADPLLGQRSPLSWADEAEPEFVAALNHLQHAWYPAGTPFPSRIVPGQVVEPATMPLDLGWPE